MLTFATPSASPIPSAPSRPPIVQPRRGRGGGGHHVGMCEKRVSRRGFVKVIASVAALAVGASDGMGDRRGLAAVAAVVENPLLQSLGATTRGRSRGNKEDEWVVRRLMKRAPLQPAVEEELADDVYYPKRFRGTWKVTSTLRAVDCPAGYKLFGAAGMYERAQQEVDKSVRYKNRFLLQSKTTTVADRAFNVTSLTRATLGDFSVLYCRQTPTETSADGMVLSVRAPNGDDEGGFANVSATLRVIARTQRLASLPRVLGRDIRPDGLAVFDATTRTTSADENEQEEEEGRREKKAMMGDAALFVSETMEQSLTTEVTERRRKGLREKVRIVETTTVFDLSSASATGMHAWQRTCTYLSRGDLRAPEAKGRPVDVRWYELLFER